MTKPIFTLSIIAALAGSTAMAQGVSFSSIDANNDNVLSRDELTAAFGENAADRLLDNGDGLDDSEEDDALSVDEVIALLNEDDDDDDDEDDDEDYDDEDDDDDDYDDDDDEDDEDDDDDDDDDEDEDEGDEDDDDEDDEDED